MAAAAAVAAVHSSEFSSSRAASPLPPLSRSHRGTSRQQLHLTPAPAGTFPSSGTAVHAAPVHTAGPTTSPLATNNHRQPSQKYKKKHLPIHYHNIQILPYPTHHPPCPHCRCGFHDLHQVPDRCQVGCADAQVGACCCCSFVFPGTGPSSQQSSDPRCAALLATIRTKA